MTPANGNPYPHLPDVEAVVYDLDGTLVELLVDWDAVTVDAAGTLSDAGVNVDGADLWGMLDLADQHGLTDDLETVVSRYERAGARESLRLPAADVLAELDCPAAVCSLNCERACHIALDTHGLSPSVDAVIGRDTVATRKPSPEPLLAAVNALSAAPERTVFVGDSERDELTATRAGTAFEYV